MISTRHKKSALRLWDFRRKHRDRSAMELLGNTVGWEDGLLYSEQVNPEPGCSKRLAVPLVQRNFLLTLAHVVPLAGHTWALERPRIG